MASRRDFRDVDRDDSSQCPSTKPSHYSRHKNEIRRLSRSLQGTADKRKYRSQEDTIDTPDSVSNPTSSESANDSAEVVDGDDAALMRGVCDGSVWKTDANFCYVVGTGVYLILKLDTGSL